MKKRHKVLIVLILFIIIILINVNGNISLASYDRSYSSYGTRSLEDEIEDVEWWFFVAGLLFVLVFIGVQVISWKFREREMLKNLDKKAKDFENYKVHIKQVDERTSESIESQIKQIDELFSEEAFILWAKNLFISLQQAWTNRDWKLIRTFETNELFERHKRQLEIDIKNNYINIIDRIHINYANLIEFRQEGNRDILVVRLNAMLLDYIIDVRTKKLIKGSNITEKVNTYLMTFIRQTGVKTKKGTIEINTTNCPNCGAPTEITTSGKCEYCGSVITIDKYNWALDNFEVDNGQLRRYIMQNF